MNLAQLVARESHSRLSRRKVSEVVPADMIECATTMPEWQSELRASTDFFIVVRIARSDLLARKRNSSVRPSAPRR